MAVDPHVKPRLVDRPRSGTPMPPARHFRPDRPGDVVATGQPTGPLLGSPGPDLGYALSLVDRFADQIELAPHEHRADAVAAGCAIAMRRCSVLGRAPTARDVEFGLTLLGYLGGAPADLVEWRRHAVHGASHHYSELRRVADAARPEILTLSPGEVAERLADWRQLLAVES
ncbi:MAG: hypothetical protein HYU28_07800 [Actinobacteria bacterium]|nr:hypothetical protein [Actinomycetota bacterium]